MKNSDIKNLLRSLPKKEIKKSRSLIIKHLLNEIYPAKKRKRKNKPFTPQQKAYRAYNRRIERQAELYGLPISDYFKMKGIQSLKLIDF